VMHVDPRARGWTRRAGPASVRRRDADVRAAGRRGAGALPAEACLRIMISVNGEEYLTVKEASRLLGVKPATLYAYVSRGVLRSYRQGIKRQPLYPRVEVEGLLRLAPSATRAANVIPLRAPRRQPRIPLAESWIRD